LNPKYDAWGNVLGVYNSTNQPINESTIGNRFLFQGREYSWKTGLYYFRARWYDPVTGRWLSNDPIGISGGLNQYVFCNDDPVNWIDPLGLSFYSQEEVMKILQNLRWGYAVDELTPLSGISKLIRGMQHHFYIPGVMGDLVLGITHSGHTWDVPGCGLMSSYEAANYFAGYSGGYIGFGAYQGVRLGGMLFASANCYGGGRNLGLESWRDEQSLPALEKGKRAAEQCRIDQSRQYRKLPLIIRIILGPVIF
jgi:RHS repeat-associated protein